MSVRGRKPHIAKAPTHLHIRMGTESICLSRDEETTITAVFSFSRCTFSQGNGFRMTHPITAWTPCGYCASFLRFHCAALEAEIVSVYSNCNLNCFNKLFDVTSASRPEETSYERHKIKGN